MADYNSTDLVDTTLGGASWLVGTNIEPLVIGNGSIPVDFSLTDSIFVLDILPDKSMSCPFLIYLRFDGKTPTEEFDTAIHGGYVDNRVASSKLLQPGFFKNGIDMRMP